jgi:hypothetical protein
MSAPFLAMRPVDGGGRAPLPGSAGVRGSLSLEMTCQEEEQWCWAAVTQLVDRWHSSVHDPQNLDGVSQSEIASHHIKPNGGLVCSTPLGPGIGSTCSSCGRGCGGPHLLSEVLKGRSALAKPPRNAPPTFIDVRLAIDADRPLPVRIDWGAATKNAGHFVCVVGYLEDASGVQWVEVFDPLSPALRAGPADTLTMRFEDFVAVERYAAPSGSGGTVNYTYEVQ